MKDIFNLDGKVALVTGGSKGLGKSMALALGYWGADLVLVSREYKELEETDQEIKEATGRNVYSIAGDIRNKETAEKIVNDAITKTKRIDILINNAGINIRSEFEKIKDEDWNNVMLTNVYGPMYLSRAVVPYMKKNRYGRIINISSMFGVVGMRERVPYCTSKGGIIQFTRALAIELATDGITVNAICPGPFDTEMTRRIVKEEDRIDFNNRIPIGRWGSPNELCGVVVLLASSSSSYITGAIIPVDGGWTAQ